MYFFFNDTATTEIYTLSLHDALPIYLAHAPRLGRRRAGQLRALTGQARAARRAEPRDLRGRGRHRRGRERARRDRRLDRKSTRLNSSHANISYAVFCLKKTNTTPYIT